MGRNFGKSSLRRKVRASSKKVLDEDKREALELIELLMSRRIGRQFTLADELWEVWSPIHLWNVGEKACFCLLPYLAKNPLDKAHAFLDILQQIEPLEEEPTISWEEFKMKKGLKEGGATALVDLLMRGKRSTQPKPADSTPGGTTNVSGDAGDSTWWSMQDLLPSESSANADANSHS